MDDRGNLTTFEEIDELIQGFRPAQILFAACRLGLFDGLQSGPKRLNELTRALGLNLRGARILCDALSALGLLVKAGESYANTPAGRRFLCSDSPESRLATLHHSGLLYRRWGHLGDSVRSGQPVDEGRGASQASGLDKQAFAGAMAEIGRVSAVQTVEKIDLTGARRLLDIGGGPGVYALEFTRRSHDLEVVILDDPETLEVARQNLQQAGAGGRISLQAGDAFTDDLGENYDVIFLSNFIHIYSSQQNRNLIRRCSRALSPGGRIVIKDFILGADRASPRGAALFAVNMLVSTEGGDCYTAEQIEVWFERAGLRLEAIVPVTEQSSLLVGRKPLARAS